MSSGAPVRTLVFTTLFPNEAMPGHGLFVAERLKHLLAEGTVEVQIVSPVPWFPSANPRFGRYARFARVPATSTWNGRTVLHPRYPVLPKVGMYLSPVTLALACWRSVMQLRRRGFDFHLIDAHYYFPDCVAAVLLGRWARVPVVATARGSDINVIGRLRTARRIIRWTSHAATATITVSEALRREMINIGADPAKTITLRNGVDLARFKPCDRTRARERLKWHDRILLMVGRLVNGKGHKLAIKAISRLGRDVRLVVVGDGPLRDELLSVARSLGVADRIELLGERPQQCLPELYCAADALILPSRSEGMANVLLESLACGTPVIATAVGGSPEVVTTPAAGVLVREQTPMALAAACESLLSAPPRRDDTRRHAEAFSWAVTTAGQIEVFRRVAGRAA